MTAKQSTPATPIPGNHGQLSGRNARPRKALAALAAPVGLRVWSLGHLLFYVRGSATSAHDGHFAESWPWLPGIGVAGVLCFAVSFSSDASRENGSRASLVIISGGSNLSAQGESLAYPRAYETASIARGRSINTNRERLLQIELAAIN